ncbi:MAG: hypothetical protein Q9169_008002, partial [Polycauliona sp. 2 TL-2023]
MGWTLISSVYLAGFACLTCASAIPAPDPQRPPSGLLSLSQAPNSYTVPPFASAWSQSVAASNTSFEEVEEEFRQIKEFKPPTCDGDAYGRSLQLNSCREAHKMIPTDRRKLQFGLRNRGRWNVNLPHRFMSSDGLCFIEIGTPAFGVSDQATAFDIAHAAWMIINTCVADYKSQGGRMDGLVFGLSLPTRDVTDMRNNPTGFLKRLSVHVSSYDPHVLCAPPRSPPPPPPADCDIIIDQMDASMNLKDFAPAFTPHMDVEVPFQISS